MTLTIMLGLLMLALANTFFGFLLNYFNPDRGYWLTKAKWRMATTAYSQPYDILILGDSSGNQGVAPSVFKNELEANTLNLCTIGYLGCQHTPWILTDYLQANPPPKLVLVIHAYDVWERKPKLPIVAQVPPWVDVHVAKETNISSLGGWILYFTHRYFPLYYQNDSIAEYFLAPKQLFPFPYKITNKGFMPYSKADTNAVYQDILRHEKKATINDKKNMQSAKATLIRLNNIASNNHFNVVVANAPMCDALWNTTIIQERITEVFTQLREYCESLDYVTYLNNTNMFPATAMENADHLTHHAAKSFTQWISQQKPISEIATQQEKRRHEK